MGVIAVLLIITTLVFLVYLLECIFFLGLNRWYWQLGPPLHAEEWQSNVSRVDALRTVTELLPVSHLVAARRGDVFCFRRQAWRLGAFPRALLRIREGPTTAILVYEVRPFLGMAMMVLVLLPWLFVRYRPVPMIVFGLIIIVIYVYYWKRELNQIARLGDLRRHLQSIGVLVCEKCGYDLFGRDADAPCPECGTRLILGRKLPVARFMDSPPPGGAAHV